MIARSTPDTEPTQDERIMAAIAHASIIAGGFGIVAAIVIWLTQKENSSYVRFQGLQATVYQFAGILATTLVWACWGCFYALSFIPMVRDPQGFEDAPPPVFWISLMSMVIPLALMALWWVYGVYGGWRTLQGRDFQYVGLGPALRRYTSEA
ncbi:MAG TPA: DUF4870 domain-containing protein [Anaerolineae bacterium]|nr:DUF4870 domain-containing protein [Anaerolineae bacterium]